MRNRTKFLVTKYHLRLLPYMSFRFDDEVEWGSVAADPKRPYGNGDLYSDMVEILGFEVDRDNNGYLVLSSEQEGYLYRLHEEMAVVIQILVQHRGIEEGLYEKRMPYGRQWDRVEEQKA